ncbi:MAG: DUF3560 domain-containing protein [Candidatus Omnitrophica bacterium]|jgi:transposase-like protein|nr:DUF3560 domain-containing protein [Candidatus Omnitrophota bacterium]
MTLSNFHEKRAAQIAQCQELAVKRSTEAQGLYDRAHSMADAIPFGQPILIGHHSEKRDRNFRDRIGRTFERATETAKKATYYAEKAERLENNTAISSDDPDAIGALREKLKKCQEFQERSKLLNKIIRKKTTDEQKIADLIAAGFKETTARAALVPDSLGRIGVPTYALTNNNGNMARIKERIALLERQRADVEKVIEIGDITITDSPAENRVLITFPGVPSEEIRRYLKSCGFRWSLSNGAWQAFRTAAWKIPQIIRKLSPVPVMPAYVNPDLIADVKELI